MGSPDAWRLRWQAIPWTPVERALFVACAAGVLVLVAETILVAALWPGLGAKLAGVMVIELFMGREAAIPAAMASGVHPFLAFQYCALQDLATGLLMYTAVAAAWNGAEESPGRIGRFLRRLRPSRTNRWATRLGPGGIFLFMLVPFLVNGPLVAGLAGRAAGMRTRHLLLPIVGATVLATGAWTFLTGSVLAWASHFGTTAVLVVVLGIAAAAVLATFLNRDRGEPETPVAEHATEVAADALPTDG